MALTQDEFARRVAVLRRLKGLLQLQRERLAGYLSLLENQAEAIGSGAGEKIIAYAEMEEQVLAGIFSVQKAIRPLEEMSLGAAPSDGASTVGEEVAALKSTLDEMKAQAREQSAKNRGLLSARIAAIRMEIKVLRESPLAKARAAYRVPASGALLDLRG
ncbi:MAG: flagellar protein FlgN [Treponema sp.]|nr:flagellar protein FlgN [Treponema sp.]